MAKLAWYEQPENLVLLTRYMAETGYSASEVARAVEKPWNYECDFEAAKADRDQPEWSPDEPTFPEDEPDPQLDAEGWRAADAASELRAGDLEGDPW